MFDEAIGGCFKHDQDHLVFIDIYISIYLYIYLGHVLTPYCRWVDISTWTPTPQGCLYLGPSPSDLDNSFFAESVLTSYNLASLQMIFNLEHDHIKILDNFLSIIYFNNNYG